MDKNKVRDRGVSGLASWGQNSFSRSEDRRRPTQIITYTPADFLGPVRSWTQPRQVSVVMAKHVGDVPGSYSGWGCSDPSFWAPPRPTRATDSMYYFIAPPKL